MGTTHVLDTAALLAGLGPATAATETGSDDDWVCPPGARAEIRPGGPTGRAVERAEAAGLLVVAPSTAALDRARGTAASTGDLDRMSPADLEVLGLAIDAQANGAVVVWSDDYAVQNVAKALGIVARGVTREPIRESRTWFTRCTGCGTYPDLPPQGECPICGAALKRTRRGPQARRRR